MRNFFRNLLAGIADINRRYATPRITMTPAVKFALLALRVYLFILIGLMIYKFATLVK